MSKIISSTGAKVGAIMLFLTAFGTVQTAHLKGLRTSTLPARGRLSG